jgi:hypothetical protein
LIDDFHEQRAKNVLATLKAISVVFSFLLLLNVTCITKSRIILAIATWMRHLTKIQ